MTGKEYKKIRESLGLTQFKLAVLLGETIATIYRREKGLSGITKKAEKKILDLQDRF